MALTPSFTRPKLALTTTKATSFTAVAAESGGKFYIDIIASVTQDDSTVVSKTVFRIEVPLTFVNETLSIDPVVYAFAGTAANHTGVTVPALSVGQRGIKTIDFSAFLTAAGDAAENS